MKSILVPIVWKIPKISKHRGYVSMDTNFRIIQWRLICLISHIQSPIFILLRGLIINIPLQHCQWVA